MKIIITGANGFLGQHLCVMLSGKGFDVYAVSRGDNRMLAHENIFYDPVELTDVRMVDALVKKISPDAIVHTAAMSKPDECNADNEKCLLNNVEATRHLVEAAKTIDAYFLYVSTDFIFGENGPHDESDIPDPLNFYGESKLMAERLLAHSNLAYSIVRPVFIYGPCLPGMRPSFLHWVKNNLEQGKQIRVVTDQWRTPTYVGDLCEGIGRLITQRIKGAYHLAGKDIISPYEMALVVARQLQLDETLIIPVTADSFPEPVHRARRSGLKIEKAMRELNYAPVDFKEGVRLTFL